MTAFKNEESLNVEKFCSESDMINVIDKFKKYRLASETTDRKLKESKFLIEQLKDEINLSKDLEKHLRNQISSTQSRLTQCRETLNKLTGILAKQKQNEIFSQKISQEVDQLQTLIEESKLHLQKLDEKILFDADLKKKNEELRVLLKTNESELNSFKTKMELLIKEKAEEKFESTEIIKNLRNELEKSKQENEELKNHFDSTLFIYKKQVENNEKIIKEYERERQSLLEDFGITTTTKSENNLEIVNSKNSVNTKNREICQVEAETDIEKQYEVDEDIFQTAKLSTGRQFVTSKKKRKLNQQFSSKPCLEFLTQTQNQPPKSDQIHEPKVKRRLFSAKCNQYFD